MKNNRMNVFQWVFVMFQKVKVIDIAIIMVSSSINIVIRILMQLATLVNLFFTAKGSICPVVPTCSVVRRRSASEIYFNNVLYNETTVHLIMSFYVFVE